MEKHNYESEATYLRMVRNWRRAVDERGLSDSQREQFCDEFLDFIVRDLMPWYSTNQKDLSQLEVNRSVRDLILNYVTIMKVDFNIFQANQ